MSRVTTAAVDRLRAELGQRDLAIVASLHVVRVATGSQLERLHFASVSPASRGRVCRRVLSRLVAQRVLARLGRRIGGARAGSAGFVYALDVAGQRLVASGGGRRPWTPSAAFLAHSLDVTELYVRLREAAGSGALELLAFDAEPACWRSFTTAQGAGVLKPDAYVRVGLGEFEDHYFVEVDRGTVGAAAIGRKLALYRAYYASGREQQARGVFPRVLWLAPDEARRAWLVDVAGRQPSESWRLFQIVRFDQALRVFTGQGL